MAKASKASSEATRQSILQVAADEIYENGFRATGLNDILPKTGLTKGAFYHHFKSKAELGLAVAQEIIDKAVQDMWITPLQKVDAGVDTITSTLEYAMAANNLQTTSNGCPLCNLAQEMANQDENICAALKVTTENWRTNIAKVLKNDQQHGKIRANIDCEQSAFFILSSLQGAINLAKPYRNAAPFRASLRGLIEYLEGLKVSQTA